jgi:hypothetical protein
MAKKEIVKKTTAKKTTKKVADKKVEKTEEVAIIEPVHSEEIVDVKVPELNYEDLYKESDKSVVVENEPEEENVEKVKEKITEIKKVNNERVNQRIDNMFGYLWNGQEMDY